MTGSGAYIAGLTVFLVQTRSVSVAATAACILVSTLGGKFGALPFSSLIDRLGGRTTYASTKAVGGLATAALLIDSSPVVITGCLIAAARSPPLHCGCGSGCLSPAQLLDTSLPSRRVSVVSHSMAAAQTFENEAPSCRCAAVPARRCCTTSWARQPSRW
ncbi:MFS transporter [Streptomyces galbus]|uniref:MFS transporter n=1 Tax=Streptomyces galbus TaxID=33898 RepID=A0ABX1IBX5_STRGB|nr:MFS transporter [Streptomyces galbus]NKQ23180.1 MFS transporter [Streptomyces galbus]